MVLTEFIAGNDAVASDINENFRIGIVLELKNHIRTLLDRTGVYSSDITDIWGEAYTANTGRNSSVSTASSDTTATFATDRYRFADFITTATTDSNSETTQNTTATSIATTCLAASDIIISSVSYDASTTSTTATTITITVGTETLASKSSAVTDQSGGYTITFTKADYTRCIRKGETFVITLTKSTTLYGLTAQSYTGTLFSFSNQTVPGCNAGTAVTTATLVTTQTTSQIYHTIPTGMFPTTCSKALLTSSYVNYENGASIHFKLQNTTEDSGWLTENTLNSFTTFTSGPTKLLVRLTAKSSGATVTYPALRGIALMVE